MGLILDSSVVIAAERRGATVEKLIGATALSLGFSLVTVNLRHFRLIPGLTVIPL